MKNRSKLTFLASVVLQALLLLMPVSAFANDGEDQEIGVPYPLLMRSEDCCFGVALSPDGDGFYSVYGGLLTHYQIDPFKKIDSVAIEQGQLKDILGKSHCRVLITEDGSKLILVFPDWIVLLDRGTGKITKKFERKGNLKKDLEEVSVLNENDLVIMGEFRDTNRDADKARWFNLTVLDVNTFQLKKQILDIGQKFRFLFTSSSGPNITKLQDRLYLSSGTSLLVLNSKTYEPELTLSRGITQTLWTESLFTRISKDYQKLYAEKATFVKDHLTHMQKDYGDLKDDAVLIFDQATRQFSREPTDRKKEARPSMRDLYDPWLFSGEQSRNKDYITGMVGKQHALILVKNAKTDYRFYPYESGEAILMQEQYPEKKISFQLTPNARQYLAMRNREGRLTLINDATFEKYHRKEP